MKSRFSPLSISLLVNAFLFAAVLVLLRPIYDSGDDVYLLYLMSGGFDQAPTGLLHYNHIMHPFLGLLTKSLFTVYDKLNWYSVVLLLANYLSCVVVLKELLGMSKTKTTLALYLVIFSVFECWMILQITFSTTALVCGIAGITHLFSVFRKGDHLIIKFIPGIALILLGSFFRIHVLIPLLAVSAPYFFLTDGRKAKLQFVLCYAAAGILILLCNQFHVWYYQQKDPSWQKEEQYRQTVFNYFNHPVNLRSEAATAKWRTEVDMLQNGLFLDSNFLSTEKINKVYKDIAYKRNFSGDAFRSSIYWLLVEARIFFCAAFVICLFAGFSRKTFFAAAACFVLLMAGLGYLFVYAKLPFYLVTGPFMLLCVLMTMFREEKDYGSKWFNILRWMALLFLLFWSVLRMYKINQRNMGATKKFRSAYQEVADHPSKLFLVTGDMFPMDYFYILDVPANYKLPNLLYKDHLFNGNSKPVLERFKIAAPRDLVKDTNVLFWGKRVPGLEKYFENTQNAKVTVSERLPSFTYGEVREIRIAP